MGDSQANLTTVGMSHKHGWQHRTTEFGPHIQLIMVCESRDQVGALHMSCNWTPFKQAVDAAIAQAELPFKVISKRHLASLYDNEIDFNTSLDSLCDDTCSPFVSLVTN